MGVTRGNGVRVDMISRIARGLHVPCCGHHDTRVAPAINYGQVVEWEMRVFVRDIGEKFTTEIGNWNEI